MRGLTRIVPALLAVTFAFAACGDGFDRDGSIDILTEGGLLTEEEAGCIIDEMVDEWGVDRVTSDDDLTAEEAAQLEVIYQTCGVG